MSAARLGERWESPISAMQSKAERRRNLARSPIVFVIAQEPFAFVWTIGIERRRRREYRGRTLINPSVASQGEMWTMLMQMIRQPKLSKALEPSAFRLTHNLRQ